MPRLPPGTIGQQVQARTNAFEMRWSRPEGNSGYVYHYDDIQPDWDMGERPFKLGNKKGTEILMRLQTSIAPDLFNPLGAFDGKKNLFSFRQYHFSSQEFTVPWEAGPSRRPKDVKVKVVYVTHIDVGSLRGLVEGQDGSMNPTSEMAITMLNLFVQSTPRMTDPRIFNMKSFFTPHNKFSGDRIRPLELWRGHFQSVRATFDRIIVNVDVTVGVILPSAPLEKICCEHLGVATLRRLDETKIRKLRLFLKGVKVEVALGSHAGKRPKTIKDVIPNVGERTFDKDGRTITVREHFERAHRHTILNDSLGVKLGSDGVFPISVCKTTQQLYKNRSSPEVVREALAFTPTGPRQRLGAITAGWQELRYNQSSFLLGAGISVNPEALSVLGRILPSPKINFGQNNTLTPQRRGQWDIMNKILIEAATIHQWTVVDFASCNPSVLESFVKSLIRTMTERGLRVSSPHDIKRSSGNSDICAVLREAGGAAKAQIILVILPESAAHIYREVKRFGDITQGVATQCVKWSKKLATEAQQQRTSLNQYHNNLILKINAKLGGANYVPVDRAMSFLTECPTMVIGADVSHPGPGSLLPSVSALVASMDKYLSRYCASIRIQASRTEIIADLAEMFETALKTFQFKNKLLPKRIFMFRDGVSEGEFNIVLQNEIAALKAILPRQYGPDIKLWPALTFIIVGKRHHFRFFPLDQQSEDPKGNGNMHAGFTVDRDIAHPVYTDFYLQSQPGLKGTSRPSHYTVLRNDMGLNADQLQTIAYALCHCYSRATRAVKIPAPVYYADLVCRRAKFHFSNDIGDIDAQSASSDENRHLDFYKEQFSAINNRMIHTMYFV